MINISIAEPWFSYMLNNKKKIEGRLNKGKFSSLEKNQILNVLNSDNSKSFKIKIINIVKYKSFNDYLSQEGLKRTLPNIKSIEDGIKVYRQFYSKEDEETFGILAIYIKKIKINI